MVYCEIQLIKDVSIVSTIGLGLLMDLKLVAQFVLEMINKVSSLIYFSQYFDCSFLCPCNSFWYRYPLNSGYIILRYINVELAIDFKLSCSMSRVSILIHDGDWN